MLLLCAVGGVRLRRQQRTCWYQSLAVPEIPSGAVRLLHEPHVLYQLRARAEPNLPNLPSPADAARLARPQTRNGGTAPQEPEQQHGRPGSHEVARKHSFHRSSPLPACSPRQRHRLHHARALRDSNPHGLRYDRRGGHQMATSTSLCAASRKVLLWNAVTASANLIACDTCGCAHH